MARLTTSERSALPDSAFAGPNRSFPITDPSHAANAKARATQGVKKGTLSEAYAAKIRAKANAKLGE